ncbi:uncharacterized protein LOC143025573 [Oratosquilla oratoria]|uniref:uncharacterized protein LOC143025573 n=1 Tax=Oratosquilla oratoria TaxID=337810 RepID=UPI003F7604BC
MTLPGVPWWSGRSRTSGTLASLLLLAVLGVFEVPEVDAFLPTKLNFSDPDLAGTFCPESGYTEPWNHKSLTREALRRQVRLFFLDNPPPGNQSFHLPADATLTAMYRAVFGPTSSPTRFIKAINSITTSNAQMDLMPQSKYDSRLHIDGEQLVEAQQLLQGRYLQLQTSIMRDASYSYGRELLGKSLHTIQKFYAHSSWLEQGKTQVHEALGIPGVFLGDVADLDTATCTDCETPQGACYDNVATEGGISSGYYEYNGFEDYDFTIPKPDGHAKCSHGGSLDSSASKDAIGGLNKDTPFACFSPHHYLHEKAASLAIKASEFYISYIRDAIGDNHFRHLLDLYHGSALSIVIDTTGSMTKEINAVKEESRLIVENSATEVYVLVPYNDPHWGPVTQTSDPQEFLTAIDSLSAFGGCCCLEEKAWHGLQQALSATPDYSDVFLFTDAGANDAELMEGVIAVAEKKHSRISIVYSYDNGRAQSEEEEKEPKDDLHGARECIGYEVTGVDEYQKLATLTGGQFIEIDKFSVDDIVAILGGSVEESKVVLRTLQGIKGAGNLNFPVDDSVVSLDFTIAGRVDSASVSSASGATYDLTDQAAMEAASDVEVLTYTDAMKVFKMLSPSMGVWRMETDGGSSSKDYSVTVGATSTLGLLCDFASLDVTPPHPGYRTLLGRPLVGHSYYVEVVLVGYLESDVYNVTDMDFVDKAGSVLAHVNYEDTIDDEFYIKTEPLPSDHFYIRVDGYLESGHRFSRMFPTQVVPVRSSVELVINGSSLTALPGDKVQTVFEVTNFGPDAQFRFTAIDDLDFIKSWEPKQQTLESSKSTLVHVTLEVPWNAEPSAVATVTLTAGSVANPDDVNNAITYLMVLPKDIDTTPPTCFQLSGDPDCSFANTIDTCSSKEWTVEAVLQDYDSGLMFIYSRPEEGLSLQGFEEDTAKPVTATYTASCCVTHVDIVGVDAMGNVAKCSFDTGGLVDITTTEAPVTDMTTTTPGGVVTYPPSDFVVYFEAENVGQTWALLKWEVVSTENVHKYSIYIDEDLTHDTRCPSKVCHENITYLTPCTKHNFVLTPYLLNDAGKPVADIPVPARVTTLSSVPGQPSNPETDYADETTTVISWNKPDPAGCIDYYQVCYRELGDTSHSPACRTVHHANYTMMGLEPCTIYRVYISAVSPRGQHGKPLLFYTNTGDSAPGAPQHVTVSQVSIHTINVTWDEPIVKAQCVDRYMISYGKAKESGRSFVQESQVRPIATNAQEPEHHASVQDLKGCTNYTVDVSAVSKTGLPGALVRTWARTLESDPPDVAWVSASAPDESSVVATWAESEHMECVDHYLACIFDPDLEEYCHKTLEHKYVFTDLMPCADYQVAIKGVTPEGAEGNRTLALTKTHDVVTSPPRDLQVTKVTAHSAVVTCLPPTMYPRCVKEYDLNVSPLLTKARTQSIQFRRTLKEDRYEEEMTGLEACMDFEVKMRAVTPSKLTSGWTKSTFTTEEDIPSPPRNVKDQQVTKHSVRLVWFAPEENQHCVAQYHVTWTSGEDSGSQNVVYPGGEMPLEIIVDILGLKECTEYDFEIFSYTPSVEVGGIASYTVKTSC